MDSMSGNVVWLVAAAFTLGGAVALLACGAALAWLARAEERDIDEGGGTTHPPTPPTPPPTVRIPLYPMYTNSGGPVVGDSVRNP